MKYQIYKVALISCGVIFTSNVWAAQNTLADLSLKQRLERLERLISSDVLRQQTEAMRSLREEISSLRGQVEQQEYELESMKQRQRSLYLDMDRRINGVEAGSRNTATFTVPVPPPNTTASGSVVYILIWIVVSTVLKRAVEIPQHLRCQCRRQILRQQIARCQLLLAMLMARTRIQKLLRC
jgi:hypothetical protein